MKRISAHYIYLPFRDVYKLHYVELNDNNCFRGVFPLEKELSGTAFFNGVLILLKEDISPVDLLNQLKKRNEIRSEKTVFELLDQLSFAELNDNDEVFLYLLDGIDLPAAKLGAGNSGRDCYIQRL